jgi:HSP20 family protein
MSITTRSPVREIETLRDRFDKLFADMTSWQRPVTETALVPLDIQEVNGEILVTASMPGIKPDDVEIEINRGVLTMRGKSEEERDEKEGNWHLHERRTGSVERTVTLPAPVDDESARATFEDGVLKVTFKKVETTPTRKIPVETS